MYPFVDMVDRGVVNGAELVAISPLWLASQCTVAKLLNAAAAQFRRLGFGHGAEHHALFLVFYARGFDGVLMLRGRGVIAVLDGVAWGFVFFFLQREFGFVWPKVAAVWVVLFYPKGHAMCCLWGELVVWVICLNF